jgi:hypothetical protein
MIMNCVYIYLYTQFEVTVAYFNILVQHLHVGTEENHERSKPRYLVPRQRFEPGTFRMLPLHLPG